MGRLRRKGMALVLAAMAGATRDFARELGRRTAPGEGRTPGRLGWLDAAIVAAQPRKPHGLARIGVFLFAGVFAAGGALVLGATVTGLVRSLEARAWVPVEARIISSELESQPGGESTTYRIVLRYDYEFGGRPWQGDRYRFTRGSTNVGVKGMREVVAAHRPGTRVTAWVDPKRPERAVIERDLDGVSWIGLPFSIPFLLVGGLGWAWVFGSGWLHRRYLHLAEPIGKLARQAKAELILSKLEPPTSRRRRSKGGVDLVSQEWHFPPGNWVLQLLVMVKIALFWNGIVAVFLCILVMELWDGDSGAWMLGLFLIPFVLVGLGLILTAWRLARQPRPPALLVATELDGDGLTARGGRLECLPWPGAGLPELAWRARREKPSGKKFWRFWIRGEGRRSDRDAALPQGVERVAAGLEPGGVGRLEFALAEQPMRKRFGLTMAEQWPIELELFWKGDPGHWQRCGLTLFRPDSDGGGDGGDGGD